MDIKLLLLQSLLNIININYKLILVENKLDEKVILEMPLVRKITWFSAKLVLQLLRLDIKIVLDMHAIILLLIVLNDCSICVVWKMELVGSVLKNLILFYCYSWRWCHIEFKFICNVFDIQIICIYIQYRIYLLLIVHSVNTGSRL